MSSRASAGFDALVITERLSVTEGGAAPGEIHVFAYLACLMALYNGRDPADWNYGFASTPAGAPYAAVLGEESERLRAAGLILARGEVLVLSSLGAREVAALRALPSLSFRERYLDASCSSATLLPLPTVADALSYEPQLRRALEAPSTRELFKPAGQSLLQQHFAALAEALRERSPETVDLLVATTVWLTYLSSTGRSADVG